MRAALMLLLALAVQGCSTPMQPKPDTVYRYVPYEVSVPVYLYATPPSELMRRYTPTELPEFSEGLCLSPVNYQRLQTLLRSLVVREAAWRSWAEQGAEK